MSLETILGIIFFVVFFILPALAKKKPPEEGDAAPKPPEAGAGEGPVAGPPTTPGRQQGRTRTGPAQASTSAKGASGPSSAGPQPARGRGPLTAGSIEEALEEIRARVREAQQQEDVGRAGRPAPAAMPPQKPAAPAGPARSRGVLTSGTGGGSLVSGEARRIGDTGSHTASSAPGGAGSPARAGRPGAQTAQGAPGGTDVSAPLEVTRRKRAGAQRLAAQVTDGPSSGKGKKGALPSGTAPAAKLSAPVLATDRASLVEGMIWHAILSEPAALRRLRRTRSRHP